MTQSALYADSRFLNRASRSQRVPLERLASLSDEGLIEYCRQGDRAAIDELLRRYERLIYRLAYRLAQNHDDAQDIASEVFVRIYQAAPGIKHAVTLIAWINRIVINVFYDMRRCAQRRPTVSLDALTEKTGDALLADDDNTSVSAQEQVEEEERKIILQKAIAALSGEQRTLITLFHSEGRTYEEIARILEIPIGTVKSRLNRGRLALRKLLQPYRTVLLGS
jgi:RNA polymerase sigma-70 factor (ECF subfamily)